MARIGEVFPAADPVSRFMVVVSMAKNDVRYAMLKAGEANTANAPEFSYLVRLSTAHFFEAATAMARWRDTAEVKKFLARLPTEARRELTKVGGCLQKVGHGAVEHSRNRTFHYPYPSSRFPSDGELTKTLAGLEAAEAEWVVDGHGRFRLKFADDVGLGLSVGKHDESRIAEQLALVRDGSIAFVNFATAAMEFYLSDRGFTAPGH